MDCQLLDTVPFSGDGFVPAEVDIRQCDVAYALVITFGVLIFDEGPFLLFKIA